MKLAWMFGSSMAAHHLLFAYLSVWLIQGGYAGWIALNWWRSKKAAAAAVALDSALDNES